MKSLVRTLVLALGLAALVGFPAAVHAGCSYGGKGSNQSVKVDTQTASTKQTTSKPEQSK